MFVFSQIHVLKFVCNPHWMVLEGEFWGRWLDYEGRTLINGINALIKETGENSFTPFILWSYGQKTAVNENRELTRYQICYSHDLRLPNLQNYQK